MTNQETITLAATICDEAERINQLPALARATHETRAHAARCRSLLHALSIAPPQTADATQEVPMLVQELIEQTLKLLEEAIKERRHDGALRLATPSEPGAYVTREVLDFAFQRRIGSLLEDLKNLNALNYW